MALYELRTYQLYVGKMADAVKVYQDYGWPAMAKGGFDAKLIGYFTSDTGDLHRIVHLWKYDDDQDRRHHWDAIYADEDFGVFVSKFRPLVMSQHNQLLQAAPWGPHP
jgi:hypothetical protein